MESKPLSATLAVLSAFEDYINTKKETSMDIERHDGTKEKRVYKGVMNMLVDAVGVGLNSDTKKLTLHFPKLKIPKKKK